MPIVGTLHKLAWGGPLFAEESWSCSLHIAGAPANLVVPQGIIDAVKAFHVRAGSNISGNAVLDFVKFNQINPVNGKYLSTTESATALINPPLSPPGTAIYPPQVATAVTLATVNERGRGHAGRFYLPSGGMSMQNSGHASNTAIGAVAVSVKDFVLALNAASGGGVVVYSKIGQLVQAVTRIKVGDVLDTQRRRRKSLTEVYSVSPLA